MNTQDTIEAAIAGMNEQRKLVTGRELAPWEVAAARKQMAQQTENAARRLVRMRAARPAIAEPEYCVNCATRVARWDSIYCSESCGRAFLTFPEVA